MFTAVFRVLGLLYQTGQHLALQLLAFVDMFFQFPPSIGKQRSY